MSRRSYITDPAHGAPAAAEGECEACIVDPAAVDAAREAVGGEQRVKALADIFGALGDPTRLRIVLALATRPLCVCDLAAVTGVTQSAVSHQLRILRGLDLVAYHREGRRAVYRLADAHVDALLRQGGEHADERVGG